MQYNSQIPEIYGQHPFQPSIDYNAEEISVCVAFGNKARVGKDFACEFFRDDILKGSAQVLRISSPLYDITRSIQENLGFKVEKDPKLLQFVGQGMREVYGENVWMNQIKFKIEKCKADGQKNFLVPDLRYKHDAQVLKSLGFVLVQIIRPDRIIDRDQNHISEVELDDFQFDYTICNDGSLEEFKYKLRELYARIC